MAASNPLAQIDEKSEIPPQVQMQLAQSKQMLQQMQQENEVLKMNIQYGTSIQEAKEKAATARKLMEVTAKAHNTETMAEVKVNDQNTRSITSQNKTEIDAIVRLLIANLDTTAIKAELDRRNEEQFAFAQQAAQDIDQGQNPLMQPPQMPMPPQQQPMQAQEPMPQSMEQQPQPMQQGVQ
jgi:hypothetical protein